MLEQKLNQDKVSIKNITHYPSSPIYFKKLRNKYIIIPTDLGITILDDNLTILQELKLSNNGIGIQDIYINYATNEIILICLVANNFIIKINLENFSYQEISVPNIYEDMWLSRLYYWSPDFIVIIGATRFYLKVPFNGGKVEPISMNELKVIDKNFTRFLQDMIKHCGYHKYFVKHKRNLSYIKWVNYEKYKYLYLDNVEEQRYMVDYVNKEKTILAPYDYEDYTFEYEYGYFVITQEYKIEVFYKGVSIFKLKEPRRVYFGGKLIQDLQHTYLYVLDGCTQTNADVVLTKYKLPDIAN